MSFRIHHNVASIAAWKSRTRTSRELTCPGRSEDTNAIIEAYTSGFQATTDVLRSRRSMLEARRSLLQDLQGLIDDLRTMFEDITAARDLAAMKANSTAAEVVAVAAQDGAQVGVFAIEVNSLAQSEMKISQGYSSEADSVGEGSLTITVAGVATEVTVSVANGTDTLSGLATAISEQVDGVLAYVKHDGNGTDPYQLVLASDDTGADQTIEVSAVLAGGNAPAFTEQVSATDAEIVLADQTIRSATNVFDEVVSGVTFQVGAPGSATVTVVRDENAIVERVRDFVAACNVVMSFIQAQPVAENEDGTAGRLPGEGVLRSVQRSMQSALSSAAGTGSIAGTRGMGLETLQSGNLQLDEELLRESLATAPDDTLAILAGPGGVFEMMDAGLELVADPDQGTIALRTESLDRQIDSFRGQIEASQLRLGRYEEALRAQFVNLEMTLAELQTTGAFLTVFFAGASGGTE